MELTFIGAGDAFGRGGRFQTCLHLSGAGDSVLLDCGATSLVALKRAGVDPGEIGWVILSHLHGDHFGGVPFLVLEWARTCSPVSARRTSSTPRTAGASRSDLRRSGQRASARLTRVDAATRSMTRW